MELNVNVLDVAFVGEGADTTCLYGNIWGGSDNDGSAWNGWHVAFDALTVRELNSIKLGGIRSRDVALRLRNGAVLSLSGWQTLDGTNVWIEASSGSRIEWRDAADAEAGIVQRSVDGGILLDGSTAAMPWLCYARLERSRDQTLVLKGAGARASFTRYCRVYKESEDPMKGDFDLVFSVPLEGWTDGSDTPLYATYLAGSDLTKPFAYRSNTNATGRVVLSVDPKSPLVNTGRTRVVRLVDWLAGIDAKNVRLVDGRTSSGARYARLFYTYGWKGDRTEPAYEGELPQGVCAEIRGIGGTFLIFR